MTYPGEKAIGLTRGQAFLLVLALTTATVIRAYPYVGLAYPAGGDYGHHLQFAETYRTTSYVPLVNEYFQRGLTSWLALPGTGMIYALVANLAGWSAFDIAGVTALTGALEVAGVFLLSRRLFRRSDAAVVAALLVALFPAGPDMIAWAGYANLLVLALLPFTLLAWVQYWELPSPSNLAVAVLMVCGTSSVHHFSTLWLGLILFLFTFAMSLGLLHLAGMPRPWGTSNPKVRFKSSAHGRYPPLRTLFSGSSSSLAGGGGGVPRGEAAR